MKRVEILKDIQNGTLQEKYYKNITPSILESSTSISLKKLNPNWLIHLNRQTLLNISDETFEVLYKLSKKATEVKKVKKTFKNLSGKKTVQYNENININYLSNMYESRITKLYNKNRTKEQVNQKYCKEVNLISSKDLYKLFNINFTSRKNLENLGIFKRVLGEDVGNRAAYYDYEHLINIMNEYFVRAERDKISPKKFDEVPELLKKNDIKKIYGERVFTCFANFPNQIFKYVSYFRISERMVLYPKYIIESVLPIINLNLSEEETHHRKTAYTAKELEMRDKLMKEAFEKVAK